MLTEVELMQWIEHFGRWNVQELVAQKARHVGCDHLSQSGEEP